MRRPFQETLEAISETERPEAARPLLFRSLGPPFAPDLGPAVGSHALWDRAADWVPDAEPETAPPPPARSPPPSVEPAAIAEELRLSKLATFDDLNRARRKFMWDNHPDRRADVPREIAHRRVATANMLLDRAWAHIERRQRKR